jgi:hypothetical protein
MRVSEVRGRVFFLVTAVAAACSPSEFSAEEASDAAGGRGGTNAASGGKGGSTTGGGGSDEPSAGGSSGGSSVGGGRGVVGGAAGMGAYGGKPPIGAAGASVGGSGLAAGGGTDAMGGSAGEPGTGGSAPMAGGAGVDIGVSGTPGAAGGGGTLGETGGGAGTSGGTAGLTGGTGAMTGGTGAGTAGSASGGASGTGGGPMTGGAGGTMTIGGCNNELLVNAGFESGRGVGWAEMSEWPGIELVVSEDDAALNAEGVSPFAGSFLAWLGGIPDNQWDHYVTLIEQYVVIPATASSLTLSGRHLVKSIDDPSAEYDEAYLEFDLDDEVVWQSLRLTNQSTSSDWVSFSKTTNDLDGLAGRTLLFYAYARTDQTGKTSFFLDSLSLIAGCGR